MYTVSITRLRIRSIWYMPLFALHAMRTMSQAQSAEGKLAVDTRFEKDRVVWTKTVWRNEDAMKQYRGSGAHQVAMRLLSRICDEAAYVRWQQETETPPTWQEAHRRLLAEGKLSRVKAPSPMHAAGQAAPPLPQPE
jgi:hypothetical protein